MIINQAIVFGSITIGMFTDSPALKAIPTAFRIIAALYPKALTIGLSEGKTSEEKEKLQRISEKVQEIVSRLGMNCQVNVRVCPFVGANACMIGVESSFGGPLMVFGKTFFDHFDSDFQTDLEFQEWLDLMEKIPNEPQELGKYLDQCSNAVRQRIGELTKKFRDYLSQEEMEFVIAHELGHAKHHHLLQLSGTILLFWTASEIVEHTLFYFNLPHLLIPCMIIEMAYLIGKVSQVSKNLEIEADETAINAKIYQIGMTLFFKKNLINNLLSADDTTGLQKKVQDLLKSGDYFSSHPNHAKRLAHAVCLLDQSDVELEDQDQPIQMHWTAKIIAGCGIIELAKQITHHVIEIRTAYFV
jgi:hypothetical protein